MIDEFTDIFGMRFVGLEDPASQVYGQYGFPNPEAPYPRDIVIDQEGIVRYWSTEYDPQKIIATVDRLLGDSSGANDLPNDPALSLTWDPAVPNPSRQAVTLQWESGRGGGHLEVIDAAGRRVRSLGSSVSPGRHRLTWDGKDGIGRKLPSGVYFVRLRSDSETVSQQILRID